MRDLELPKTLAPAGVSGEGDRPLSELTDEFLADGKGGWASRWRPAATGWPPVRTGRASRTCSIA